MRKALLSWTVVWLVSLVVFCGCSGDCIHQAQNFTLTSVSTDESASSVCLQGYSHAKGCSSTFDNPKDIMTVSAVVDLADLDIETTIEKKHKPKIDPVPGFTKVVFSGELPFPCRGCELSLSSEDLPFSIRAEDGYRDPPFVDDQGHQVVNPMLLTVGMDGDQSGTYSFGIGLAERVYLEH